MKNLSSFLIYDAAAGSGKTYSLVKKYLSTLLSKKKPSYYKQLLALTFTNKAVSEMKERIIASLVNFANPEVLEDPPPMFLDIVNDLEITPTTLQKRANNTLNHLLHNYAAFSVETIDSFNHRLIRTFAKDLKLPTNFEVVLDIDPLLNEAVDALINKAGKDEAITKVLVEFALEKTDEDRSWDISYDLFNTSKMLANEDDARHLEGFKDKSLTDFIALNKFLKSKYSVLSKEVTDISKKLLEVLELHDLSKEDFSRGSFFTHFKNLASGNFDVNLEASWILKINDANLYPSRLKKDRPEAVRAIEELLSFFIDCVTITKQKIPTLLFIDAILRKTTPLSVINLVQKELEQIKENQNIVPLFQFNSIINNEIKNQPAPFIYERMGEKFKHFYVDEFQDTSVMQWENLKPLIENTLTQTEDQKDGSLLLVGDVKQAIYRWRGGKPEQFLKMIQGESPFPSITPQVENLPVNYRSSKQIVAFNNNLFTYIASLFSNPIHQKLFIEGNRQEVIKEEEGYVAISFVNGSDKEEKQIAYAEKTLATVTHLIENGFNYSDICILTRRRADGVFLSTYLMEQDIPIVSSETLLLGSSQLVNTLVGLLKVNTNPDDKETLLAILDFLYSYLKINEEKHKFFASVINEDITQFPETLKQHNIQFSWQKLKELSIYEAVEYCIAKFNFSEIADAYLFSFMDFVFDFEQKQGAYQLGFLSHWEKKREKEAISAAGSINGVQFMTIHKSKGLEFPVVIFPFADISIYKENQATTWIPLPEDWQLPFKETLINYSGKVEQYSEAGAMIHKQRKETLQLDTFNLLYVTLTRAVDQLYIFSETPSAVKKDAVLKTFPQVFKGFLEQSNLWEGEEKIYKFGTFQKKIIQEKTEDVIVTQPNFITTAPEQHDIKIVTKEGQLWDTDTQDAIDLGNLLHDTMEQIYHKNDAPIVLEKIAQSHSLTKNELNTLNRRISQIINHPELISFYKDYSRVENERNIITKEGHIVRPDRLIFHDDKSVSIIDYKTGKPDYSHEEQINLYGQVITEMGFTIKDKIVVYIANEISVNNVNLAN